MYVQISEIRKNTKTRYVKHSAIFRMFLHLFTHPFKHLVETHVSRYRQELLTPHPAYVSL